jgi:CRP/FNR family cyclic AMP-dependent transcriptional regulator
MNLVTLPPLTEAPPAVFVEATWVTPVTPVPPVTNKVWYLQQSRLFSETSDGEVAAYQHLFRMETLPKRTRVFDVGDPARIVYLVKYGKVRIARLTPDGKEVTVAVLGSGDIFGEETLFDATLPRSTVAICVEETLLCMSRADELLALLSSDPQIALNVAKILSGRLDDASETIEDVSYAKVPDRIVHLFQRLSHEHGRRTQDGIAIDVALTHGDIASAIGSTRETVSLELSKLIKAGRVKQEGRKFVLPDELRS